ncbi:MAG: hypothetical protein EOP49_28305, partial [Sphingobacteriales bacterium]
SVALSADGNTALTASHSDDGNKGAAWVFTRTAGVWTQQGPKIVATDAVNGSSFTFRTELSADGRTAAFGSRLDNNGLGAVWIWVNNGTVWTQQGNKLLGTGAVGNPGFGSSVSISADGNTLAAGAIFEHNENGAVWIWTRNGGIWTQQGSKLTVNNAPSVGFGSSVSLSADGNHLLSGGLYSEGAWVFSRTGGEWSQKGNKLLPTNIVGSAGVGEASKLSFDGSTAILGGARDNDNVGAVWVFTNMPDPVVSSVTPLIATMGSTINITGSNFNDVAGITFGGTAAASYTVNSSTSISAVVGSGTTGSIGVATYYGSGNKTGFTFLSPNANLSSLQTTGFNLSPTFQANVTSYTATVGNTVSSISLMPTIAQSAATVKINGQAVANMTYSNALALSVGSNTITVEVTAENATSLKSYTITIVRAPSSNADLSQVTLSTGPLSPTFSPTTTAYTATVSNATSSLTITPTISEATATINLNGNTLASGSASTTIPLTVGSNSITISVTAGDGTTTKSYSVNIVRAVPDDLVFVQADLDAITAESIRGSNTDLNTVVASLSLPTSGASGSVISWSSSNINALSNAGAVIN